MLVPYKAIIYYTYPFGRVVFCQSLTYGGQTALVQCRYVVLDGSNHEYKICYNIFNQGKVASTAGVVAKRRMDVSQMSAVVTLQRLGFIFQVWSVWYVRLT